MSVPKVVVSREICATRGVPVHHVRIVENQDGGGPPIATSTQVLDEFRYGRPQHYHITAETHDRRFRTRRSGEEDIEIALNAVWPAWKSPKAMVRRLLRKK